MRKKVREMDLMAHFYENENPSGLEILLFANREHVLILDTYQLIDLRKLIKTAFNQLEYKPVADYAA